MNRQAFATTDWETIAKIGPFEDRRMKRPPSDPLAYKLTTFPRQESTQRYFEQAKQFGRESAQIAIKTLLAFHRLMTDASSTTVALGEFRVPTTDELIAEIRQRSELARLREENEALRAANRRLRMKLRTHAAKSSGRAAIDRPMEQEIAIYGFELPRVLAHFGASIERSRAMLELEDDWDGEGSPGYTEETWRRAVAIAIASAGKYIAGGESVPPAPAISKGPEGSVDLLWRLGTKKLMINVPADTDEPVTFHGFDAGNLRREFQGVLDPNDNNEWVLSWLIR